MPFCVNNSKSVFTLWSEAESNRRNHPRLRRKKKAGDSKNQNASPYNPWCPSHLPTLLKTRLSSQICELTTMFYHQ
nr:MAG TPA: hypothetical protein [Bacteriophage sp.]